MRLRNTNTNLYSDNLYTDRLLKRKMSQIKEKFFEYLEENDTSGRIDADKLISSDASIFQFEDKFKQFIQSNAADFGFSADFILENIESERSEEKTESNKKSEDDKKSEEDFDAKSKLMEFINSEDEDIPDDKSDESKEEDEKKESIFDHAEEFNKFLSEDEDGLKINEQYAFNFEELSNFEYDEETGKFITNEDTPKEQQKILDYISEMLLNEDIKKHTDSDENGKVTKDEVLAYLNSLNEYDEDKDNLTLRDIFTGYNEIVNPKSDTENPDKNSVDKDDGNSDKIPISDDKNNKNDKTVTPSDGGGASGGRISGGGGASGGGGVSGGGSSGVLPSYSSGGPTGSSQYYNENPVITRTAPDESSKKLSGQIGEIDKQIAEKNKEINSLNEDKAKVYASESEYNTLVSEMNEATSAISASVSNLTTLNSTMHLANITYETKKAELDNLQDAKVLTQLQPEIDSKKASLKAEVAQLETAKNNVQTKINNENKNLKTLEDKKAKAQENIDKYEKEHPKSEINTINSKITQLNTDIRSLESKKATIKTELEKTQKQEVDDGKVYGLATAYRESNEFVKFMMDYATNPSVRASYDNNSKLGEWCAIFTSEVTEAMFQATASGLGRTLHKGSQDLGGSEMAMLAIAYARKHAGEYASAGLTGTPCVDISSMSAEDRKNAVRSGLIYPGMTFEYKNPKTGAYHTGFIESINPDLTWNTIEGNSTGGKSAQHVRDGSYEKLADVVDTTYTAYYLAIMSGKMSAQEANSKLYANIFKHTVG